MDSDDVVAQIAPELLFKLIPKFLALGIHLCNGILVFGIGPPQFHPDGHDRSCEGAAEGSFASNSSAKPCGQFRKDRILNPKILLETQGDRFRSVEPLIKKTLCLLRYLFHFILLSHSPPPHEALSSSCLHKGSGSTYRTIIYSSNLSSALGYTISLESKHFIAINAFVTHLPLATFSSCDQKMIPPDSIASPSLFTSAFFLRLNPCWGCVKFNIESFG